MDPKPCLESPLVGGKRVPCQPVLLRSGRVACYWCRRTNLAWHYDDLREGDLPDSDRERLAEEVEDERSAGVILLLVGMACGLGIGLVLAWAVMS